MTVKLQAADYTAVINPRRGANCISLQNLKYNAVILREPDKSGIPDNPYLYGMPLLFPPNRISNAEFEFENRIYKFPVNEPNTGCFLHGTIHETDFSVLDVSTTSIKLYYEATKEKPYLSFPHEFSWNSR